jgi:hypothetical protein
MAQPGTPTAVTHTSRYLADLSALAGGFKAEFLSKFVPLPSPAVPSCVGALTERMASRLLLFFVRHAALVRPLSQVRSAAFAATAWAWPAACADLCMARGGRTASSITPAQPIAEIIAFLLHIPFRQASCTTPTLRSTLPLHLMPPAPHAHSTC